MSKVSRQLISDFQRWLSLEASEDTVRSYGATLFAFCLDKEIKEINDRKFFYWLQEEGARRDFKIATIARHIFAVKKFLVYCNEVLEMDIINLQTIRYKKAKPIPIVYLEPSEINAIRAVPIKSIFDMRNRTLFEFLLDSGCRISEATNIKWEDINFEKGEVEVLGKGRKKRVVFLKESVDWIQKHLEQRVDIRIRRQMWHSEWLFISSQKKKLTRDDGCKAIKGLAKRAGIEKNVTSHVLRKTFVTYLIWAGVDPKTVQIMAGHEDLETTLKYYTAVTYERMREAHLNYGRILNVQQRSLEFSGY